MKKLMISLFIFLPLQIVSGQDKIITIQNDTIHCRVLYVTPARIQYEQKAENGFMIGKFIPTEQVLEYYQNPQPAEINPYNRPNRQALKPSRRWMVGLQSGASFLIKTSESEYNLINRGMSQLQDEGFYKQLKRRWHLHADIYYLPYDYFGWGAKYSFLTSSAQKDVVMKSNDNYLPSYLCVGMKERQYIHYAGPSVIFRQWLGKSHQLLLTEPLSIGYVHYRDELRMDAIFSSDNGLVEGNTWGATCGISLDYFPLPYLSIGVNAGAMYSRLSKLKMSDKHSTTTGKLDRHYYQSLSRIDCSLGIRFHF